MIIKGALFPILHNTCWDVNSNFSAVAHDQPERILLQMQNNNVRIYLNSERLGSSSCRMCRSVDGRASTGKAGSYENEKTL